MTLRFVGIDPNTGGEGSPTVWVGEESADLVHDIPSIIEYVTTFTPLSPGDVIVTGTPGGVGLFMEPPGFITDGGGRGQQTRDPPQHRSRHPLTGGCRRGPHGRSRPCPRLPLQYERAVLAGAVVCEQLRATATATATASEQLLAPEPADLEHDDRGRARGRHEGAAGYAGVPHGRASPRSHGLPATPPPAGVRQGGRRRPRPSTSAMFRGRLCQCFRWWMHVVSLQVLFVVRADGVGVGLAGGGEALPMFGCEGEWSVCHGLLLRLVRRDEAGGGQPLAVGLPRCSRSAWRMRAGCSSWGLSGSAAGASRSGPRRLYSASRPMSASRLRSVSWSMTGKGVRSCGRSTARRSSGTHVSSSCWLIQARLTSGAL
ncbi:fumarylacetoacetate hydrolase family protein [Streptomyces albidoflavus]|uniref:fumarylacetoacetate hydrolase family protein n=1 Tax=Streptomyces albidoflavus TaxID=1886 RepID=UPI00331A2091